MAAMRVGVYVDAFNVYYGGRGLCGGSVSGWRWLDLAALAMGLINPMYWPNARLERFAYCTAPRNRAGDPSSLADQQTYVGALGQQYPMMTVTYGRYVPRTKTGVLVIPNQGPGREIRVPSPGTGSFPAWLPAREVSGPSGGKEVLLSVSAFEEKGSDVNVASHLLIDVLTQRIDSAIVLSNDSDLEFPLAEARRHVPIGTVNPMAARLPTALKGSPKDGVGLHWWRQLNAQDFCSHQLPDPCGPHSRPAGW